MASFREAILPSLTPADLPLLKNPGRNVGLQADGAEQESQRPEC